MKGFSVVGYNGTGFVLETLDLSGEVDNEASSPGFGAVWFPLAHDDLSGIALMEGDVVVQFLSWDGQITAVDGAAQGTPSEDIGLQETSTTPAGMSLQLKGTGLRYTQFEWHGPHTASPGLINALETFMR